VILYTPSMIHRHFCVARFQLLNSWADRHEVRCLSSEEKTESVFSKRNFLKATPGLKHISERHYYVAASVEIFQTARLDIFLLYLPSQISASSFMSTELVSVFSAFCCQNLSGIRFRGKARELRKWNTLSSRRDFQQNPKSREVNFW
jgi:hypothetical protein